MELRKALGATCIFAVLLQCCRAQYRPFSNVFGNFGFGEWENERDPSSIGSPTFTNSILSLLANRWGGTEDQMERRLDDRPEHVSERVEQQVEKASDKIEKATERKPVQTNNILWNTFLTNRWNSWDDRDENGFDDVEDRIENRFGDDFEDTFEDRFDNDDDDDDHDDNDDSKKLFGDSERNDWFDDNDRNWFGDSDRNDWFDDRNENRHDDAFERWNNVGNFWGNNNGWSNSWNTGNDDFWDF